MGKALPKVSIVITTRNRKQEVLRAIESCLAQSHPQTEILVFDDASEDATSHAIESQFPSVLLHRQAKNVGQLVLRNRGFHQAQGDFVFSLDDDAYFSSPDTIRSIVEMFMERPDVAVIALPFVEPGRDRQGLMQVIKADKPGEGPELRNFVACAAAFRKSAVLSVGGYRESLFAHVEESDLSLRLYGRGFRVVYADTDPIIHLPSRIRNRALIDRIGVRNTLLFDALNIPHPYMLPRLLIDTAQLLLWMPGWPDSLRRGVYVLRGLAACLMQARHRKPVSRAAYRRYRSLPLHGPAPWTSALPESLMPTGTPSCSSSN